MTASRLTIDSTTFALVIVGFCGTMLAVALIMEHAYGLVPCPLCLMQRLWFFAAGLIAVAGLMHDARWGIYPVLTIAASIAGAGFAIRQLYLQSLPADQAPACAPPIDYLIQEFPLREVLAAMTRGTGDCATVDWSLLGVSTPGWALAGFVAVAVLAAAQFRAGNRPAW
jgi:protein dithiol:quinone oxidoreductase